MKTCIECTYWSMFDGCCWCPVSPRCLQEVDGDTEACKEFAPEEIDKEAENEDDS